MENTPTPTPVKKRSKVPGFLKKKRYYIIAIILLIIGYLFWQQQKSADNISYETAKAEQGTLLQTVEVTGEIRPAARIDLAFETAGTLTDVKVKVGDDIKKGDLLAVLKDQDLGFAERRAAAALNIAQANLNARLAGESDESIQVAEAQYDQAVSSYQKALSDLENTRIQVQNDLQNAQIALETSKNNLDNASPISEQNLENAIESAKVALKSSEGPLNSALIEGDAIIGVDDTAANQYYESVLGIGDDSSVNTAENKYKIAKADKMVAKDAIEAISSTSNSDQVYDAVLKTQTAVNSIQEYLLAVKHVLANTITNPYFTAADLASKKSIIDSQYSSISTQKSAIVNARQAIEVARLSKTSEQTKLEDAYRSAQVAYEIAKTNINMKIAAASSSADIQKAAMDAAKAALDLKKAPPRAVDVAGLRAQVQDARVAYDQAASNLSKARIYAPVSGTVTDVVSDVGEQITPNTPQIRMIGTEAYDIEAQVPEADIAKIKVGQTAEITLDAYGDDIKFQGTVTAENPDQTKIQDAIYYNIRVNIDPGEYDIKPGMTANVTVKTAEVQDAIIIPLRAIRTDADTQEKTVRILVNNEPQVKTVQLGLKGDEGRVQALSGVSAGDEIILREITGK